MVWFLGIRSKAVSNVIQRKCFTMSRRGSCTKYTRNVRLTSRFRNACRHIECKHISDPQGTDQHSRRATSAVLQSFWNRRILFCFQNMSTAFCSSSKERKRTPTSILPPPSPVWMVPMHHYANSLPLMRTPLQCPGGPAHVQEWKCCSVPGQTTRVCNDYLMLVCPGHLGQ